jgi:hypothetical protein
MPDVASVMGEREARFTGTTRDREGQYAHGVTFAFHDLLAARRLILPADAHSRAAATKEASERAKRVFGRRSAVTPSEKPLP